MDKLLFETDAVARVGWSGWIETGLDGVVYIYKGEVRYVPILDANSVAASWPSQFRQRLTHELIEDKQMHFIIVHRLEDSFDVVKIRRDDAERIIKSGEFARHARRSEGPIPSENEMPRIG